MPVTTVERTDKTAGREYEEYLPLSTRVVCELCAICECLGWMAQNKGKIVQQFCSKDASLKTICKS